MADMIPAEWNMFKGRPSDLAAFWDRHAWNYVPAG